MTWEDLNEDNIQEIKQMYIQYIQDFCKDSYRAQAKTFEEFYTTELSKCFRCDNIVEKGQRYCECCHDDLFVI